MIRAYRRYSRNNHYDGLKKYIGPEAPGSTPDVVNVECPDDYYNHKDWDKGYWQDCTDTIIDEPLNRKNAHYYTRTLQANAIQEAGYEGPVSGGEARSLARFLREIGKENHVRRAWHFKTVTRQRNRRRWASPNGWTTLHDPYTAQCLTYCYVFKPLVKGYTLADFMRVVRMYKPGEKGGCRAAIKRAMVSSDFAADLDMLKTLDLLAGAQ